MPRKQKVVEQIEPEPTLQVIEQTIDDTTIQTTIPQEAPAPVAVEVEVLSTLPTEEVKETKVKPKRKAQPKKIEVKEIVEVKEPEETKEIIEEPKEQKKVKTLEQAQCNTCEKEMTKRTLRYHHKCPGEVKKTEELPVKKRVKKEAKKEEEKTDENNSTANHRNDQQSTPIKEPLPDTYHARLQKALEKRNQAIQRLASQIV